MEQIALETIGEQAVPMLSGASVIGQPIIPPRTLNG